MPPTNTKPLRPGARGRGDDAGRPTVGRPVRGEDHERLTMFTKDERDRIERTGMTDWERQADVRIRRAATALSEAVKAYQADPSEETAARRDAAQRYMDSTYLSTGVAR